MGTDIRRYSSYLYRNPLLQPQYLNNTREGTPINLTNVININVEGDDLLHAYIRKLDEEIFSELPDGLTKLAEAIWVDDEWSSLGAQMFDEARKHGWCLVQFYDEDAPERWRVFTVVEFTDFIKEPITVKGLDGEADTEKIQAVGMKFEWGDYLGNAFREEVRFDDETTHLIKFRKGNGRQVFAFPDLSEAIMSLAFEIRQIKGQLTFSSARPSYQHFKYGQAADDDNIDDLDSKIKHIDSTSAIGAPMAVLDDIVTVKNENIEIIEPALEKMLQYFAGATRLPLSYYIGQRNRSGFGITDIGEKSDMVGVINKKNNLFKTFLPFIEKIFEDVYDMDVGDLELAQDVTMEAVEEDDDGDPIMNKGGTNPDIKSREINPNQEKTGFQSKQDK